MLAILSQPSAKLLSSNEEARAHFVWHIKMLKCHPSPLNERAEATAKEGDFGFRILVCIDGLESRPSALPVIVLSGVN